MIRDTATLATLFSYSDWSNRQILDRAAKLTDAQLDQTLDIGRGTLRRNLTHTLAGESVWLLRWKQTPEVPWPDESKPWNVPELLASFTKTWAERDAFLGTLTPYQLAREQVYRDSKGSLFSAALGEMVLQGFLHSKHHQAQSVNMLRRVGGEWPEVDYMNRVRRPVG